MNAFYLVTGSPQERGAIAERAAASMLRQGFAEAFRIEDASLEIRAYVAPWWPNGHLFSSGEDFAFSVGMPWYRDSYGNGALELMVRGTGQPDSLDAESMRGTFTVVLRKRGGLYVFSDPLDLQRVYRSQQGRLITSSWLTALDSVDLPELDRIPALEYVLYGAAHGESTPARQVRAMAPGHFFDVDRLTETQWLRPGDELAGAGFSSQEHAVEALGDHFSRGLRRMAAATDGRIRMALSGGFDSRLILAGLMANGIRPDLFVYGAARDADVRIARAVAEAEGLRCRVADKAALERAKLPLDQDAMEAACLFFDGTPVDGILDRGTDRETRLEQFSDGALALNGGGGEILRNFFHLPDRAYSAEDLVKSFYSGFDSRALRHPEDVPALVSAMSSSIRAAVGASTTLSRQQVELAYPLFRCRYWMGRNNAVSNRWGLLATPLVDRVSVRMAAQLPLTWKAAGAFEGRIIAALHPRIAAYDSSYGFSFGQPPNFRTRWEEWSTRVRPIWSRPLIPAAKRALSRSARHSGLLADCRRLLGPRWHIESLLDLAHLGIDGPLQRAATLEYLIQSRSIDVDG